MADGPTLKIKLRDVSGHALRQPRSIRLRNETSGVPTVVNHPAKKDVTISDVTPGIYLIQVAPAAYRAVSQFVNVTAADQTTALRQAR